MRDWRDLNGDGEIDGAEMMFAEEMLCTSKEALKKMIWKMILIRCQERSWLYEKKFIW